VILVKVYLIFFPNDNNMINNINIININLCGIIEEWIVEHSPSINNYIAIIIGEGLVEYSYIMNNVITTISLESIKKGLILLLYPIISSLIFIERLRDEG
jgi:hypothetical protein